MLCAVIKIVSIARENILSNAIGVFLLLFSRVYYIFEKYDNVSSIVAFRAKYLEKSEVIYDFIL